MIPLKDDIPTQTLPVVTVTLITLNVVIYLYELALWPPLLDAEATALASRAYEAFVYEFGLVPCRLGEACPSVVATRLAGAPDPWLTVVTSMFVHGGLFHLAGNMLYLWIFGNNVEDAMGPGRFVSFYVLCGVLAAGVQYLSDPGSAVPMVGASGAVSGALGAYLVLFPHARVWTLFVFFGVLPRLIPVPALIVLGFWIVVQALNATLTFGQGEPGGIAFLAHVGGFATGMALILPFRRKRQRQSRRWSGPL